MKKEQDAKNGSLKRLLTVEEAGILLALGPWRVRTLIWSGELPYVRLGRRILIETCELEALIQRKKRCEGTK
jgi:excisionase family DNA binding protein